MERSDVRNPGPAFRFAQYGPYAASKGRLSRFRFLSIDSTASASKASAIRAPSMVRTSSTLLIVTARGSRRRPLPLPGSGPTGTNRARDRRSTQSSPIRFRYVIASATDHPTQFSGPNVGNALLAIIIIITFLTVLGQMADRRAFEAVVFLVS
jgi:hypothetical protein